MTQTPAPPVFAQRIIRSALLAGVLLFGAVIYYLRSSGSMADSGSEEMNSTLIMASGIAVFAALVGIFVMRGVVGRASAAGPRFQYKLVGWALGEGSALFGGVVYLISGNPLTYIAGVGALVVAILWLPVSED